jgi:hypothetical protein
MAKRYTLPLNTMLAACAGPSAQGDASIPMDSRADRDTGEVFGPSDRPCPPGMTPIPADAPVYCIDTYEASYSRDGELSSDAGRLPLTGITFDEARALCAARPVLDGEGHTSGFQRLATLEEWRDAADGQLGEGGSTYTTGEEWPVDRCVVLDDNGQPQVSELQLTGSQPDCVSSFGVVDQLGNAWEWVDPGLNIDIEGFLNDRAQEGTVLSIDDDRGIRLVTGDVQQFFLQVAGLAGDLRVTDDGQLLVEEAHFEAQEPFDYNGFLVTWADDNDQHARNMLPIEVERPDGADSLQDAPITVLVDEDGAPVTAKVGCAWYAGYCENDHRFRTHLHSFKGTIGLRCSCDPL